MELLASEGHGDQELLLDHLLARPGLSLFFGATDTGKTTLVRRLASTLSRHGLTAVVDSDVGQSSVGPPACLGACLVKGPLTHWPRAQRLHFVGNYSPLGHFLPMLTGLVRLVSWARREGSFYTLVDTTGFVTGGAALELKCHKVDLLGPEHLILIEQERELEPFFSLFRYRFALRIHRLKAAGAARTVGPDERRAHRACSLRRYFERARRFTMPMVPETLVNPYSWRDAEKDETLPERLVGLMDGEGNTLALGAIRHVDTVHHTLILEAPLDSLKSVTHLRLGRIRLDRNPADGNPF